MQNKLIYHDKKSPPIPPECKEGYSSRSRPLSTWQNARFQLQHAGRRLQQRKPTPQGKRLSMYSLLRHAKPVHLA